jgi:2-dehydropantoate 2-reductase
LRKVLIAGTGALGTLFAARLALAGNPVVMLGSWAAGLEALNRAGARLLTEQGEERRAAVQAASDPAIGGGAEVALVLVKAWQTEQAARQLAASLPAGALVVTLQNGLGNREILAGTLGAERVALGVCTYGANLLGPGVARSGGEGVISLEAHPRSGEVADLLRGAGFQVEIVAGAQALVWGKLVMNAAINPLTALLRVPNGRLLELPAARWVMIALALETARVARACGVELPFDDPAGTVLAVARRTAANRSSMLQDVERGAPTEIEAICGAVVRAARAQGRAAPLNWLMWRLVSADFPGKRREKRGKSW